MKKKRLCTCLILLSREKELICKRYYTSEPSHSHSMSFNIGSRSERKKTLIVEVNHEFSAIGLGERADVPFSLVLDQIEKKMQ